ncbi:MAG: hypothetical protein AAGK22_28565 [Acidobacteriota bacterium]
MNNFRWSRQRARRETTSSLNSNGLACVLLAALLGLLATSSASSQTNFYPKDNPIRDNGLDMNDDGVVGEPGVDDRVCDDVGGSVSGNRYMEDVDDDGVLEEQIFVDTEIGNDSPSCGRPTQPCRTLAYAYGERVDGPGDGNEDIVCFAGTDSGSFDITVSGLSSLKTRSRDTVSTNEARSFQYPRDPTMLIGWDVDDDGIYPPNDPDHRSRLSKKESFQFLPSGAYSNVEVAHLETFENGHNTADQGGFFEQRPGTGVLSHWYFHDIHIDRNNYRKCHRTASILWSFFRLNADYIAAENIRATDTYGYLWRGAFSGSNVRFANWSVTHRAIGGSNTNRDHLGNRCTDIGATSGGSIMRIWSIESGRQNIEWIDSRLEVVGYDNPLLSTAPSIDQGITLTCLRDLTFAGNYLRNYPGAPLMDMNDGICRHQLIADFYWNNNTIVVDDPGLVRPGSFYPAVGWLGISGGPLPSDGITGTIQYNNNLVDYTAVPEGGAFIDGFLLMENVPTANLSSATVELVGNRLIMDCNRPPFGCLIEQHGATQMPRLRIRDNILYNPSPSPEDAGIRMIDTDAMIGNLTSDSNNNVYYNCNFLESGTQFTTMASWRNNVGEGNGSVCGVNLSPVTVFGADFESGDLSSWSGASN